MASIGESVMTKSLTNRLYLKQHLYTLMMREGMSLKTHLDKFNKIIMNLKYIYVKVDDEDQALIMLCSLPSSYEHFITTLLYRKDSISMKDVKASLHSRELRKRVSVEEGDSQVEGLVARGRTNEKGSFEMGKSRSKNYKCHYYHKPGHFRRDCLKLKEKGKDVTGVTEDSSNGSENVLIISHCSVCTDEEWILDSSCSFQMCPNRSWFTTYKEVNGGTILMGNNMVCKIVGVGTIQIRMHDGIDRTLTDVRHILNLKKNLISLGALDSIGCKCTIEGGVMRVTKGALVVMRGQKNENLYVLQGSTVLGATTDSSSIDTDSDTTRLWHMRLGHMDERGMTVLSKQGLLGGQKIVKLNFYEDCVFGKQRRVKFSTAVHKTKGTLDYVHSNLWRPS